jgi:ABC-type antimicrobial peptide transport system permease subunit
MKFTLQNISSKAKTSLFYLWLFNQATARMIPFNRPHGFKITRLTDHEINTYLPYKKLNLNHIKGVHACALATLSEFTTGALLLTGLPENKYRIILKKLEIEYHFQAKMDVMAYFSIDSEWVNENITVPLLQNESAIVPCIVDIKDKAGNHISTAKVFWQLKEWSKVRTKV